MIIEEIRNNYAVKQGFGDWKHLFIYVSKKNI